MQPALLLGLKEAFPLMIGFAEVVGEMRSNSCSLATTTRNILNNILVFSLFETLALQQIHNLTKIYGCISAHMNQKFVIQREWFED